MKASVYSIEGQALRQIELPAMERIQEPEGIIQQYTSEQGITRLQCEQ
ncbi:MAG: hypothetical protein J4478_02605 [Candidatus Diapherotrites archaeon]|uniref:Uncharacterized protein n=1 Tax=Candidatus Iainarchaeum sp. TaxID=3101447 RepID=A0A8T4KVU8_9ARCH|nr:hypothetical protein [Candidatus Diapherotrites archaeon]